MINNKFIWNFGLIQHCVGAPEDPRVYFKTEGNFNPSIYGRIKQKDIVHVKCKHLVEFCESVLPNVKTDFVLYVGDGDESFPSSVMCVYPELISNKNIKHIFAQNCEILNHPKISHIPIGLDLHTVAFRGGGWGELETSPEEQENLLLSLSLNKDRKIKAFVDFQHSDTMRGENKLYLKFKEDRKTIFENLKSSGCIDYSEKFQKRSELWKIKSNYEFSISPHGNGLDCHRTWEDLVLGCKVIVKTSSLDKMYEDLPVIIVKNWDEITLENMRKWSKLKCNRKKLESNYWLSKMFKKARC